MSNDNKQKLQEFMNTRFLGVISTVDHNSRPESAFVGYSVGAGFEVIVGTSKFSRKAKNILSNDSVALVVADETGEVQYEGRASQIEKSEYEALIEKGRFKQLEGSAKYRNDPDQVWLKIQPTWIRFIEHGEPDRVEEFTEFS